MFSIIMLFFVCGKSYSILLDCFPDIVAVSQCDDKEDYCNQYDENIKYNLRFIAFFVLFQFEG